MSTLQELERNLKPRQQSRGGNRRPAPSTFDLTPDHFAEDWSERPVAPITVGIRVPSEAEAQTIEDAASREAKAIDGDDEERDLKRERSLQAYWVARSLCDPLDVTAPHPFFEMPEDMVPLAFKPDTIARLCQEIAKVGIEQSPLHPEADDEELGELSDLLATGVAFADVAGAQERLARRYLKFALEIIRNE